MSNVERQLTSAPHGHILTNIGVWSPDGKWIVFDTRSDPAGSVFDGATIQRVHVETGAVETIYPSQRGACCGVVTHHPSKDEVVFILGPENPTADWAYAANKRQGVIAPRPPARAVNLDARDLVAPFTPGALRGGTHVHVFSADGGLVSFTYNDQVLSRFETETAEHEIDVRNVGVSVVGRPVAVPRTHERNHDGSAFSVLVTRTHATPLPGSDQIKKAYEDAWIGRDGYVRADGSRQRKALAFLGDVVTASGATITELFVVDLPDDLTAPDNDGPLQGTATLRPRPPKGTVQRRLTFTADRQHAGVCGPRFWPRSSPDGSRIAVLMKDDAGVGQLWTVGPEGGAIRQVTRNAQAVGSAFSWSPDGKRIAHVMDNSVCVTEVDTGATRRLTPRSPDADAPRPEACVFSPDGRRVAYVRNVLCEGKRWNQIFVVDVEAVR